MKILPAPYMIPLLFIIPLTLVINFKYFYYSTSYIKIIENFKSYISELVTQACGMSFIACCHYWIHKFIVKKLKLSSLPVNVFFVLFYSLINLFTIYDFENTRFNLQSITMSTLKAYVVPSYTFSKPLHQVEGDTVVKGSVFETVIPTIIDSMRYYSFFLIFMFSFFIVCICILIKYKKALLASIKNPMDFSQFYCESESDSDGGQSLLRVRCGSVINRNYGIWVPKNEYNNPVFKTVHTLGLLFVFILFAYFKSPTERNFTHIDSFPHFFFFLQAFTHYEKRISLAMKKELLNITRKYLPKGRYWLDNRENPIYPLVHGDINAFCAYNNHDQINNKEEGNKNVVNDSTNSSGRYYTNEEIKNICENISQTNGTQTKSDVTNVPNVVFLIYESFNPFSYLINEDFIEEHANSSSSDPKYYISDLPYYSNVNLPFLSKYAKTGITFAGLSSQGLPTVSGWHSLMAGVPPSQTYLNMVDAYEANVDDLPSHFHGDGFRTFYISTSKMDFDGANHWAWRKTKEDEAKEALKCNDAFADLNNDLLQKDLMGDRYPTLVECTPKEVKNYIDRHPKMLSFPKWFDYVADYTPDRSQAALLGLPYSTIKKDVWQSDRVVAAQFNLHWRQQRSVTKKPIFGVGLNIDPHVPYHGFDTTQFYDKIPKNVSKFSTEHKKLRFLRINRYTDKYYINNIIEFIKKEDPNTIVAVVGDHGTRDIPVRYGGSKITQNTVFNGDCYKSSAGPDSLFVVSGTIFYLGEDENIKKIMKLDKIGGKTLKMATDHNDFTYTMLDIIARIKGEAVLPTHKISRNLIDLTDDILDTLKNNGTESVVKMQNESKWQSISYLTYQMEYKKGSEFIRTHSSSPNRAHYYNVSSFPTCIKKKGAKSQIKVGGDEAKRLFKDMVKYLNAHNYLLSKNIVYNYEFRDKKCIENGYCELPKQLEELHINDNKAILVILLPLIGAVLAYLISSVFLYIVGKPVFNNLMFFKREISDSESYDLDLGENI